MSTGSMPEIVFLKDLAVEGDALQSTQNTVWFGVCFSSFKEGWKRVVCVFEAE